MLTTQQPRPSAFAYQPDAPAEVPIASDGRYAVLAQRHEVMWPNGSSIDMHPVRLDGVDAMFLRAVLFEGLHWVVFDLRHLARHLAWELPAMPARDKPGLVFFTLRHRYPDAPACLAAAVILPTGWIASATPASLGVTA